MLDTFLSNVAHMLVNGRQADELGQCLEIRRSTGRGAVISGLVATWQEVRDFVVTAIWI